MTSSEFLKSLDQSMAMKNADWLQEQLKKQKEMVLLDFRGQDNWENGHISGSIPISIKDLPERVNTLIPFKDSFIISICNGSIQSAMATMFLRTQDFKNSYNLSGGYSSWIRNERPIVSS